jgi:hypothetical protein
VPWPRRPSTSSFCQRTHLGALSPARLSGVFSWRYHRPSSTN